MTRAEVVAQIVSITGRSDDRTDTIVLALLASIIHALAAHEAVTIRGFGTFHCKLRNQTTGRDLWKKHTIIVPAHYIPFFTPHSAFKDQIGNASHILAEVITE